MCIWRVFMQKTKAIHLFDVNWSAFLIVSNNFLSYEKDSVRSSLANIVNNNN